MSLATAVLALVSALVGGAITAGASVWVANMTVQSQQKQSVAEYRRNNREKIYQDMFAQMTAMDSVMDSIAFRSIFASYGTLVKNEDEKEFYDSAFKQWEPAYDRLTAAVSNAELVSSRQVIGISKALVQAYNGAFKKVLRKALDREQKEPLIDLRKQGPLGFPPELEGKSPDELKPMFITAAKNDLALND